MANKIAVMGGLLGFVLSFLAGIPVGIVFTGGITGLAGISVDLYHAGSNAAYFWGHTIGGISESWFVIPTTGVFFGICMFCAAIIAATLALCGAVKPEKREILLVAFCLELVVFGVALLDQFYFHVGVSGADNTVWGGGMYLLFAAIAFLAIGWRFAPASKKESD